MIGLTFSTKSLLKNNFSENKFFFQLDASFGRKTSNTNQSQTQIKLNSHYIININNKNSVFIRNESGLLDSKNLSTNELFRIGGANSIRGFNEESILTDKFSYLNLEYRFNSSKNSMIYSIFDIGNLSNEPNKTNTIYNLGIGFKLKTKATT